MRLPRWIVICIGSLLFASQACAISRHSGSPRDSLLDRRTPAQPLRNSSAHVPEASSLVLGLAAFLMIGYGWLRSRWSDDSALQEEETMMPAHDPRSTGPALKD